MHKTIIRCFIIILYCHLTLIIAYSQPIFYNPNSDDPSVLGIKKFPDNVKQSLTIKEKKSIYEHYSIEKKESYLGGYYFVQGTNKQECSFWQIREVMVGISPDVNEDLRKASINYFTSYFFLGVGSACIGGTLGYWSVKGEFPQYSSLIISCGIIAEGLYFLFTHYAENDAERAVKNYNDVLRGRLNLSANTSINLVPDITYNSNTEEINVMFSLIKYKF